MDTNHLHQTRYQLLETAYTLQQQAAQLQQQISDNAALQRNLDAQLREVTAKINEAPQPAPVATAPVVEPALEPGPLAAAAHVEKEAQC